VSSKSGIPAWAIVLVIIVIVGIIALVIWGVRKQYEITQKAIETKNPAIVAAAEAPLILGELAEMINAIKS